MDTSLAINFPTILPTCLPYLTLKELDGEYTATSEYDSYIGDRPISFEARYHGVQRYLGTLGAVAHVRASAVALFAASDVTCWC